MAQPIYRGISFNSVEAREPMSALAQSIESLCDLKAKLPVEYQYLTDGSGSATHCMKNEMATNDGTTVMRMITEAHAEMIRLSQRIGDGVEMKKP